MTATMSAGIVPGGVGAPRSEAAGGPRELEARGRPRAMLPPSRLLPADSSTGADLASHLRRHGPLPPRRGARWRAGALEAVADAGLVGRGGAGFPTARKLRSVASQRRRAVVVANGTEGEPASRKDRVLLARAPHLVLDGAVVAAELVGASQVVAVVHPDARSPVDVAVAERRAAGVDTVAIRVVTAAAGFVAGEASAVVNWVANGRPVPVGKNPRMSERGIGRRPTLVQNVETLAHLALVARHGAAWYRAAGTPDEPGTVLVTLLGAVAEPGVYEVEVGTAVSDVLARAGGATEPLQALLVGGYFGTWVPAAGIGARPFSAAGLGAGLGAGLVAALPARVCGIAETARLVRYLASESAGQCGPCVFGLPAIAGAFESLAAGRWAGAGRLDHWLEEIVGRGACGHPDGVAHLARSALDVFADEVADHRSGWCRAPHAAPFLPHLEPRSHPGPRLRTGLQTLQLRQP